MVPVVVDRHRDGNYGATLELRLAPADTVFFFDFPTWLSLAGVLQRWTRHHGNAVQAEGCPEHVSWEFLRYVWRFRRHDRPRVLAQLSAHAADAHVVVVRSRRAAARALGAAARNASDPKCQRSVSRSNQR
jgi:adenylate kinase family enzyme